MIINSEAVFVRNNTLRLSCGTTGFCTLYQKINNAWEIDCRIHFKGYPRQLSDSTVTHLLLSQDVGSVLTVEYSKTLEHHWGDQFQGYEK